jgi:hypothetical protein
MAGIGNSIYMRHPAPVTDNPFKLTIRINLTLTYLAGGLGHGRVLARPKCTSAYPLESLWGTETETETNQRLLKFLTYTVTIYPSTYIHFQPTLTMGKEP